MNLSSPLSTPSRVLAVDDDAMITGLVRKVIRKAGHDCETAVSTEQALALLSESSFDLVITDVNMGGLPGMDLLESARKLDPDLAVVMVSGIDDPITAESAFIVSLPNALVATWEPTRGQPVPAPA